MSHYSVLISSFLLKNATVINAVNTLLVSSSKLWDAKKLQAGQNLKEFLVSCPKLYHLSTLMANSPAVTWASSVSTLSCSPSRHGWIINHH